MGDRGLSYHKKAEDWSAAAQPGTGGMRSTFLAVTLSFALGALLKAWAGTGYPYTPPPPLVGRPKQPAEGNSFPTAHNHMGSGSSSSSSTHPEKMRDWALSRSHRDGVPKILKFCPPDRLLLPDNPCVAAPQNKSWYPRERWLAAHAALVKGSITESIITKSWRPDCRLVFIGDSITESWKREGKHVWDEEYATKYNALNLGISGDEVQHVLWRVQHGAVEAVAPEVAVILIGTNNIGNVGHEAAAVAAGIELLLAELRLELPGTRLVLMATFPRDAMPNTPFRKEIAKLNKLIYALNDDEHIFYLDIGSHFTDKAGKLIPELMPDELHLSAQGYEIWADQLAPTLAKLMRPRMQKQPEQQQQQQQQPQQTADAPPFALDTTDTGDRSPAEVATGTIHGGACPDSIMSAAGESRALATAAARAAFTITAGQAVQAPWLGSAKPCCSRGHYYDATVLEAEGETVQVRFDGTGLEDSVPRDALRSDEQAVSVAAAASQGQLQRGSNCLPLRQGFVDAKRHAIWLRDRSNNVDVDDAALLQQRDGQLPALELRPTTIVWEPPQKCNRKLTGLDIARCLVALPRRRVVLAGDSNFVKLIGRLRTAEGWFRGAAFSAEFDLQVFTANDDEYRNHQLGKHAWWQDIEIAITEKQGAQRTALLSFRFNHGGYGAEGLETTIDARACAIVAQNFSGLALKDGVSQWSRPLQRQLPASVQRLRRQPADVLVYCPGLWGLVDWAEKTDEQRAAAREMLESAAAIVAGAAATKRVWVTTGQTDGTTKGFKPGIQDQRGWVLPLLDLGGSASREAQQANELLPMLLLDWWAVGDMTHDPTRGPVVEDFNDGGFHLAESAQDALLHLIWEEVCGGGA